MAEPESSESSRKRIKLSSEVDRSAGSSYTVTPGSPAGVDAQKELDVGIIGYVSPHGATFSGILKKRYTDFLVNEILPSGEVLHLRNTRPSTTNPTPLSDERIRAVKNGDGLNASEQPVGLLHDQSEKTASAEGSNIAASEVLTANETPDQVCC
jgi:tRNA pseudouridine13 synthase